MISSHDVSGFGDLSSTKLSANGGMHAHSPVQGQHSSDVDFSLILSLRDIHSPLPVHNGQFQRPASGPA